LDHRSKSSEGSTPGIIPPRGIFGQRIEEGFHAAKEFILLFFNSFLLFFACSLSSSGLEAARRAFADDLERCSVFVARRFISVLLIVVAKTKMFRDAGGETDDSPASI
jgi:hypothetical protein